MIKLFWAQEQDRQEAGSQADTSDSQSMHSPGASGTSEASVAQSARSGRGRLAPHDEPAMISFEDEIGPMASSRSTAGIPHSLLARIAYQCASIQTNSVARISHASKAVSTAP